VDKWIRDLINTATGSLRALIDSVWQRVAWVYNVFVSVFVGIRDAWNDARGRISHYLNKAKRFMHETVLTLHWIAWIHLPQRIASVANDIVHWAATQIQRVVDYAYGLATNIIRWVTDRLNEAQDFVNRLVRWISNAVNEIHDAIARMAILVYMLLTDPKRMAAWVIDALMEEFLRYMDRNFDRLYNIVRERAIHYTLRFADRLESILERMI
jgi:phage-related protein